MTTLKITGDLITMGDMGEDDMPKPETPRIVIALPDGRDVMVIGLTREEVTAAAPLFMAPVTVEIRAAQPPAGDELPTTRAGWLHRCDMQFAEGYGRGRKSQERKPLTAERISMLMQAGYLDADDYPDAWAYERGVRDAERAHGITATTQATA